MELVIVIVVIAAIALVTLAGLLVSPARRRRGRRGASGVPPTARPSASERAGTVPPRSAPPVHPEGEPARPEATETAEATAETAELDAPVQAPERSIAPGRALDVPDPTAGRLVRLRGRLARSQSTLGRGLLAALSRERLDEDAWEEIEDTLLVADMGVAATQEIVSALRERVRVLGVREPDQLRVLLRDELLAQVGTTTDRTLHTAPSDGRPAVVLMVGVNGTGKTTTCGKLARVLVADGRSVLLGAADTFRAAAADQLQTWGERVGARTVRGPEGGDPGSVAFEAVQAGIAAGVDTVVIDTAGRLHTKAGLMDELAKVKRVVEKQASIDETLLVLDATTGQNGVRQAKVFTEAVAVSGIVLTKLDGTAKGGIVVAVQRELGVPVKLVGLGEGPDDLAPFEPEAFVDALVG